MSHLRLNLNKREFIKDPVWGTIELFPWEKTLLNHHIFNRLHHVLQNSSGYRVYPGLRHSRFLHSVGVMHVVTQIYLNALRNTAEPEAVHQLNDEKARLQLSLDSNLTADQQSTFVNLAKVTSLDCTSFMTLCVLRMGALLHDVGHLPYSHVFENAIDAFIYSEPSETSLPQNTRTQSVRSRLADYLRHDKKIHEIIGEKISLILEKLFEGNKELAGLIRISSRVLHSPEFPLLKSLLSGDIDADRIDFVKRDGYFSGLYQSSVDYSRLFSAYEFAVHSNGTKEYLSRPSLRAAAEAEKLIFERFQFYRYVPSHHRVHLFDEILIRIIVILIQKGSLLEFFETLCELLALRRETVFDAHLDANAELIIKIRRYLRMTFDDIWFDGKIREAYSHVSQIHDTSGLEILYGATTEDRLLLKSLHKGEAGAADALGISHCNPEFIYPVLSGCKFQLEQLLVKVFAKQLSFAIVGDLSHRLSVGLKTERMAAFLGVEQLRQFLRQKHLKTLPFNVWFAIRKEWTDTIPAEREKEYLDSLKRKIAKECLEFLTSIADASSDQLRLL